LIDITVNPEKRPQCESVTVTWAKQDARDRQSYSVCVTNVVTKRSNIYWGGPGERWVSQFAADLAGGFYGSPDWRNAARPRRKASRPRLVSGGRAGT